MPSADFSDPSWGQIATKDYAIEINMGREEELMSFQFRIRGEDSVIEAIATILEHLRLRAYDPNSATGFFDPKLSKESLQQWRNYRNQVLG